MTTSIATAASIAPPADHVAGLTGEIFHSETPLRRLSDAQARMEEGADGRFVATRIDYGYGGNGRYNPVAEVLAHDADSLSSDVDRTRDFEQTALRLTGQIWLEAGTHQFFNRADDGVSLQIDGREIVAFAGRNGGKDTRGTFEVSSAGWFDIRVDYFDAWGSSILQIEHSVNNGTRAILSADRLAHLPPPAAVFAEASVTGTMDPVFSDGTTMDPVVADDTTTDHMHSDPMPDPVVADDTTTDHMHSDPMPDPVVADDTTTDHMHSDPMPDPVVADDTTTDHMHSDPMPDPVVADDTTTDHMHSDPMPDPVVADDTTTDHMHSDPMPDPVVADDTTTDHMHSDPMPDPVVADDTTTDHMHSDPMPDPVVADDTTTDHMHSDPMPDPVVADDTTTDHMHSDPMPDPVVADDTTTDHMHSDPMPDHAHMDGMGHGHHAALFGLVDHADATHVAIKSGSWFDPATWAGGEVPGENARVVVGAGVEVIYDGQSDARLFTVRVDGNLTFASDRDSKMVVDTMVVDHSGKLTIGTADNPVAPDVQVEIVIANNGAIDVAWDPELLSRGIVSNGAVEIHGAEKTTHLKVSEDPMAGDTSLTLAEIPEGWQAGDTIVIAGTRYDGYKWDGSTISHHEPEDEVRTISHIEGNTVFFDDPLVHNHDTPRADLKTSVANYSRNVSISTEDPETAATHERGHVMFMHSDQVDVRYAEFHELGRTDKSLLARDASEFTDLASDSNVKGRYSFHFHRSGIEDPENPAMAVGNAVFGSPGWGFVHHDSNAVLEQNATYNTFGAGFVAESGNEIGRWTDNIAIYAKGVSWAPVKMEVNFANFDTGKTGDGFWFQGRMVESNGNIAASVNHGFAYFHRGELADNAQLTFDSASFELPEAFGLSRSVAPDDAPILHFRDNEAFAAREGLHIVKANPNQGHDIHSVFDGFTAWSVKTGAHFEYTSHYTIRDFDLVGKEATRFSTSENGISFGPNTSDMTVVNATIDGFDRAGINLKKKFTDTSLSPELHDFTVIDATITNSGRDYANYDPTLDTILSSSELPDNPFSVTLDAPLYFFDSNGTEGSRIVALRGTKTDSLGDTRFPSGTDDYDAKLGDVVRILRAEGYYTAADGKTYIILETYFSDRLTGEIHKFGFPVELDPGVVSKLGKPNFPYKDAKYAGTISLDSLAPETAPDAAVTLADADVVLDVIINDADPDGDALRLDGILQPDNGFVFENADGTVTYRPDGGFIGTDTFEYWARDDNGNFTKGFATVEVATAIGTDAGEILVGTDKGDYLLGGGGDDILVPGGGKDGVNGGDGIDIVRFEAAFSEVAIHMANGRLVVTHPGGETHIVEAEILAFAGSGEFRAASDWTGETPEMSLEEMLAAFGTDGITPEAFF